MESFGYHIFMQVAAMFGEGRGGVVDKPDPQAAGDIVVVKIRAVPMCTEYKGFISGGTGENFGHEAAGEVVEVAQPGRVKVGDRVVVQPQNSCGKCEMCAIGEHIHCLKGRNIQETLGTEPASATYAQYMHKMEDLLSPIPDGVSYEHAGMAVLWIGTDIRCHGADAGQFIRYSHGYWIGSRRTWRDCECPVSRGACYRC